MTINGKTFLYGIVGNPVSHSMSPTMHNRAFTHMEMNCVYLPFPVQDIEMGAAGLKNLGIRGVSVTIPHKEAILPHLDVVDPVAMKIGAVNTVKCVSGGERVLLKGFNTDWIGANRALETQMGLEGAEVVILGAGGSARAIGFGLKEAGAKICLCSRTEQRGRDLAAVLECPWYSLNTIDQLQGDALINATSVGMSPGHEVSPVGPTTPGKYRVVMDIVYAPLVTKLLSDAEKCGCATVNGLEMLLLQGVAQFEIWTEQEAPVEVMRSALLEAVG